MNLWRRIANPTKDAGPTGELYGLDRFITDHVFRTKTGQLCVAYELQGIDPECIDDQTLEDYSQQLLSAFRIFDEDFRIYQYLIKNNGNHVDAKEEFHSPATKETLENREEFLRAKGLYSIRLYFIVVLEAGKNRTSPEYLLSRTGSFSRSVSYLLGMRVLPKQEAFHLLRLLANLDRNIAGCEVLKYDNFLDYRIGSSAIAPSFRDGIAVDTKHVEVLTLREPPRNTMPNLLTEFLKLEGNFVLATEFRREPADKAAGIVNAAQNHFHWMQWMKNWASIMAQALSRIMGSGGDGRADIVPDASATENVEELKKTIVRINNEGDYMGQFSLTAIMHATNRSQLQGAVTDAQKILGQHEGSLIRETYNALNAYRAVIPGGHKYNFRRLWMHATNYLDMSLVYAPRSGESLNKHLNAPHLLTLETTCGTPFYFNLHESDLLGVLIFGIMGSGKSFATNLFIDHTQQYKPFTFVLDVGGSYRLIAQKHGGSYVQIRDRKNAFAMNPFALQKTEENLDFLASFVSVLLHHSGHETTPKDDQYIDKAVRDATRLSKLDLPQHLTEYLYNWVGNGRYGHLFDNAEDTLQVADFQCFDFQGMSTNPKVLEPVFFYIFQRISEIVYRPSNRLRFKQLWADEVWKFLATRSAREYFIEAGKTWRKHNGGIGLITQSAGDLEQAGMLDMINEICPTKILLANPGANREFYRKVFNLNDKEVGRFVGVIPKQQFFLKTPTHAQVLNVFVDKYAEWQYRNDPNGNAQRDAAIAELGLEDGLKKLAAGTALGGL